MRASNERQRALQGVTFEHQWQVVRQGVVDGSFYISVKAQNTLPIDLLRAMLGIV